MPSAPAAPAASQRVPPAESRTPAGPSRRRRGSGWGLGLLALTLLVAVVLSLTVGSVTLDPGSVLRVLVRPDASRASSIVHGLRVPRTLLAVLVGACLGVGGTVMQGHTRNPLADPGLLGISAGSALFVVVGIFALGITSAAGYAWLALLGAGVASVAVFAIGSTRGGPSPVTLVLAGTAVSALLLSLTSALVLRDAQTLDQYRFWVVGSVTGRDLGVLAQVAPFMALGLVLAAVAAPAMNLLQLGDDVAASLGMHPVRHKLVGLAAVMLLTGAATAACGPLGFVGLVVPHVARFLAGVDYRWVVPYAALVGAVLLVLTDVLGRVVARPGELQVGIVTALVGGPAFVLLVRRSRLVRL